MITVKYFGAIADQAKRSEEKFSFSKNSLNDLLSDLTLKYFLNELSFSVAVNQKMVQNPTDYNLNSNDVIALLPPFAGG
ncbi:MAG: MoaD/ThiS family protein [Flavobacterium sp.]|nr:MoaD/ThiS family protein [Flavobacterium sp.]